MNLLSKIRMSSKFGKVTYAVSAALTVSMNLLILFAPFLIGAMFLLKLLSIPVIFYLQTSLTKGEGIYFYLNLGISRKEYYIIPMAVEFLAFTLISIITTIIGYGIA